MSGAEKTSNPAAAPWWKVRMLWLVLGGPLVVVLASFVTLGLALSHPDPVLQTGPAATGNAGAGSAGHVNPSQLPALQGRNNAATGGK
jgi:hypothetical protein